MVFTPCFIIFHGILPTEIDSFLPGTQISYFGVSNARKNWVYYSIGFRARGWPNGAGCGARGVLRRLEERTEPFYLTAAVICFLCVQDFTGAIAKLGRYVWAGGLHAWGLPFHLALYPGYKFVSWDAQITSTHM